MLKLLRPKIFFAGVFLGFIVCSILGYLASQKARFHHFTRFFDAIGPAVYYYPTPNELLATARHEVDPDKILVLIGGSSIFRGVGQNPDELWSIELQKTLGNQFKVLNYANDGASFASFGGGAFRMLIEQYPKIIFVSTCSYHAGAMDGNEIYQYFFWDAYYKRLFHPDPLEVKRIRAMRRIQMQTAQGIELHIASYLDSICYFKSLWNWVGYRLVFTVWNRYQARSAFQPKRKYADPQLNFKIIVAANTKDHEKFLREIKMITGMFPTFVDLTKNRLTDEINSQIHHTYDEVFTPRYRSKTLCVFRSDVDNPKHIAALPKKDQQAYQLYVNAAYPVIESMGYHSMRLHGLLAEDFGDAQHLVASGGKKIAAQVADEIHSIARANGY